MFDHTPPPSFMRLVTDSAPVSTRPVAARHTSQTSPSGLKLRAMPADYLHSMKIQPEIGLAVERIAHDGIEAHSDRPLSPGGRLSLLFPDSPFLPKPGTLARVERCTPGETGYRIQLSYEAQSVA